MPARKLALAGLGLGLVLLLVWTLWARIWPADPALGIGPDPDRAGDPGAAAPAEPGAAADSGRRPADPPTGGQPPGPTFSVQGRVQAVPGVPILGARVLAYPGDPTDRRSLLQGMFGALSRGPGGEADTDRPVWLRVAGDPLGTAEVAADGAFAMAGLPRRHLRLVLEHDFYGLHRPEPVQCDPDSRAAQVWLRPYLGGLVRGRVLWEGSPAGREIHLQLSPGGLLAMQDPQAFLGAVLTSIRDPAVSDQAGQFVFRAVPTGLLLQIFSADEHGAGRIGLTPLAPGETRETLLALIRPARLSVSVRGTDGRPIADARVTVRPSDGVASSAVSNFERERTGAEGTCAFPGLVPGRFQVSAGAGGHVSANSTVNLNSGGEHTVTLTLGTGGTVEGIVVDPDGQPVADAGVSHFPALEVPLLGDLFSNLGTDLMIREARDAHCRTNAQGRFLLTGIEDPNPFHVVAAHPDFAGGAVGQVRSGDREVRIELRAAGAVTGRVVAAEDGQPLAQVEVEVAVPMFLALHRPVRQVTVAADAGGTFRIDDVPPGSFKIIARAEGRGEVSTGVQVEGRGTADVGDLRLPRAARVAGVVIDDAGQPVGNALVRVRQGGFLDNEILASMMGSGGVRTGGDGRFDLRDLAPGRITLLASAAGRASGRSPRLELAAGAALTDVEIVLGRGGTLVGRVLFPPGQRPDDWLVLAKELQSGNSPSATPDVAGRFRIDGLDPGQYEVQALRPAAIEAIERSSGEWQPGRGVDLRAMANAITEGVVSQRCTVRSGDETEVVLDARDLGVGGRLTLRVLLGDRPLESGIVELTHLADGRLSTGMLDRGEVQFSGVSAGVLGVQVRGGLALTPIGERQHVEFPAGTERHTETLRLPGGELHGRVVDAGTGQPLRDVLVRLLRTDAAAGNDDPLGFALTDAEGMFRFLALPAGSYGVVAADELAARPGAETAGILRGIQLTEGAVVRDLVLRAQAGARIRVRAQGPDGAPLSGALVTCVDPDGRPLVATLLAVTGPDGVVHLAGLPAGEARVVGRAPGLAPAVSDRIDLQPDQTADAILSLGTGTRVVLQPVDRQGRMLPGAALSARTAGGPWLPASLLLERVQPDGGLDLGRLSPGEWEFRIEHPTTGAFTLRRAIAGTAATLVCSPP